MTAPASYEESLHQALQRITGHIPEDLVEKFARESGITKSDIHLIPPGPSGTVSAIDGSNTMIAEGGSITLAAIRAGRTTFSENVRAGRSVTPITLVTIGPGHRNTDFDGIYQDCFGIPPHKGLDNADPGAGVCHPPRHAGVLGRPPDGKDRAGRSTPAPRRGAPGLQPEP